MSSGEVSGEESATHLHPEATRLFRPWSHTKGGKVKITFQMKCPLKRETPPFYTSQSVYRGAAAYSNETQALVVTAWEVVKTACLVTV